MKAASDGAEDDYLQEGLNNLLVLNGDHHLIIDRVPRDPSNDDQDKNKD